MIAPPFSTLQGLSGFPVTPADPDGIVDTEHVARMVAHLSGKVQSIGVLGSTGSYMYLSPEQRDRALAAAVEAAGDAPVLAGIGALTTAQVIRHARFAEAAGAAALLLAPVSYLPLTDEDFFGLVEDVSDICALPICIYNNPGTTHFTLSKGLLTRLATLNTVAGVKNPAPLQGAAAELTRLRGMLPEGFVLGYSGDAQIAGVLGAGADAWYSVLAGTMPDLCAQLWAARQNPTALAALNARLAPLWDLFRTHGAIRVIPHIVNLLGLGPYALPEPLRPLPNTVIAQIEQAIQLEKTE